MQSCNLLIHTHLVARGEVFYLCVRHAYAYAHGDNGEGKITLNMEYTLKEHK